jgi:uncharacterized protein (TIGR00255 family)
MKSMTGYGRATAALGTSTLTVVVSSVNRKTLDLAFSLPEEWESLETEIAEAVRRHASRGKVNLRVELTGDKAAADSSWDEESLALSLDRLEAFSQKRGIPFRLTPELIWEVASSQRRGYEFPDAETARVVLLPAVEEALRSFAAMRAKEGEALLVDFLARIETLRRHLEAIAQRAPAVPAAYREILLRRLREAGLELQVDDERVLKEIALFADRCDVTEEITRFRSHLEQFTTLIRSEAEIGRKAEFILQEMGREVNTTGSKANDIGISRNVIELKNELERIREQVANVE